MDVFVINFKSESTAKWSGPWKLYQINVCVAKAPQLSWKTVKSLV